MSVSAVRMKNSILEFNIIITTDIENIAPCKSVCALLILHVTHLLISTNGELLKGF